MADKPIADLSRSNDSSNAFAILAACRRGARKAGWTEERTSEVLKEMQAGDYDNLLATAAQYFTLKLDEEEEHEGGPETCGCDACAEVESVGD